ncbi:hypothetical protein ACK8P5_12820 [Paenibacillus sp. EC2-1]|uniref:hypothetical protein n=1 Tax=Paenibacillus sp. EC2-1 TaxID=3388665 RepID=UPI003BEF1494
MIYEIVRKHVIATILLPIGEEEAKANLKKAWMRDNVFEGIDFSPGRITYNETYNQNYMLEEDLFHVSYNEEL